MHTPETEGQPSSVALATYSYWTPTAGELQPQHLIIIIIIIIDIFKVA